MNPFPRCIDVGRQAVEGVLVTIQQLDTVPREHGERRQIFREAGGVRHFRGSSRTEVRRRGQCAGRVPDAPGKFLQLLAPALGQVEATGMR